MSVLFVLLVGMRVFSSPRFTSNHALGFANIRDCMCVGLVLHVLTELASFPPRSRSAPVGTGKVQPGVHFPPAPLRPACPRTAPRLPA